MSFYGQVIQEFTRLFSKFTIKTNDTDETAVAPLENSTTFSYEAGTMWDTLKIEPTNRWVQMRNSSSGDMHILSVGHGTPGAKTDESFIVSSSVPEVGEPAAAAEFNQLKNGDYLTLTTEFDNAGHLNATNKSYYRLPVATINIGTTLDDEDKEVPIDITPNTENDKLLFRGDNHWLTLLKNNDILEFKHTTRTKEQLTPELAPKQEDPEGEFYWAKSYDGINWEFVKDASDNNIIAKDADGELTPEPWEYIELEYQDFTTFTFGPQRLDEQKPTFLALKEALGDKDSTTYTNTEAFIASMAADDNTKEQTVYLLSEGDIVKSYDAVKDEQGHILSIQELYFKLPVSPGGADFSQHTEEIYAINQRLLGKYKKINPETGEFETDENGDYIIEQRFPDYETNMDLLQSHNTWLMKSLVDEDKLWSPTCLYDLTGSLEDIYTNTETIKIDGVDTEVLVNRDKNLAKTIGSMDADTKSVRAVMISLTGIGIKAAKDFYSISEVLQEFSEQYIDNKNKTEGRFNTQNLANQAMSTNLRTCSNSILVLAELIGKASYITPEDETKLLEIKINHEKMNQNL